MLKDLTNAYSDTTLLSLEYKNLTDLTPLVKELAALRQLEQLSLHGNKLRFLPSLESLAHLKRLDISKNPIAIDKHLLDSLYLIPKLIGLTITVPEALKETLVENLPRLETLNGSQVLRKPHYEAPDDRQLMQDLQQLAKEKQRVSILIETIKSESHLQAQSQSEIDFIYNDAVEEVRYFNSSLTHELAKKAILIFNKNKLSKVLQDKVLTMLDNSGKSELADLWLETKSVREQQFEQLVKHVLIQSYNDQTRAEVQHSDPKLRKEVIYLRMISRLKHRVAEMAKELAVTSQNNLKYLEQLSKVAQGTKKSINLGQNHFQQSSYPDSAKQLNQVEARSQLGFGQSMTQLSSKKSLSKINRDASASRLSHSPSIQSIEQIKFAAPAWPTHSKGTLTQVSRNISPVKSTTPLKSKTLSSQTLQTSSVKFLRVDEIKNTIGLIMHQKQDANQKCLKKSMKNRQSQDYLTLSQFVFSYFHIIYGLKQVALEWTVELIRAVDQYAKTDVTVRVFGKILKNKLPEKYFHIHLENEARTAQVVRQVLHGRRATNEDLSQRQEILHELIANLLPSQLTEIALRCLHEHPRPLRASAIIGVFCNMSLQFWEKTHSNLIQMFARYDMEEEGAISGSNLMTIYNQFNHSQMSLGYEPVRKPSESTRQRKKIVLSELFDIFQVPI